MSKLRVGTDLPPEVLEKMEADKPSKESSYWAKSGCKHCYGRGEVGVQNVVDGKGNSYRNTLLCICARKSWDKWREEWVENYKKAKREESQPDIKIEDRSKGNGHNVAKAERAFQRIDRLESQLVALQSVVNSYDDRLSALPQHDQLSGLTRREEILASDFDRTRVSIESDLATSEDMLKRAEQLREEAARCAKSAMEIEKAAKNKQGTILAAQWKDIEKVRAETKVVEKDLGRDSKTIRKRKRETQKKIDRLLSRRGRIVTEAGITETVTSQPKV